MIFFLVYLFSHSYQISEKQKYAKWKAAYIHRCLKDGETPIAGPVGGMEDELGVPQTGEGGDGMAATGGGPAQPLGFGGIGDPAGAASFGVPGFSQPTNPLTTFSQPTNPPATFSDPYPPAAQPQAPVNPVAPHSPAMSHRPAQPPPAAHQPGGFPSLGPASAGSFDPQGAAAAAAAVMRSLGPGPSQPPAQPQVHSTPVPAPRARTASGLIPIPGKDVAVHTLDFDQKQRLEKLLKYVSSALMYDDMPTVAQNITRAYNLVHFGKEE